LEGESIDGTNDGEAISLRIQELKELKKKLAEIPAAKREKCSYFMRTWRLLLGDQLEQMLASEAKTKDHLRDPSWQMRLAAISILREYFAEREELAPVVEKMAFEDPHPQVRATALSSLASCFRGTGDPRIGRLLAEIVTNESMDKTFREAAYQGLFELTGRSGLNRPIPGTYRFPEDVEHALVERFRGGS